MAANEDRFGQETRKNIKALLEMLKGMTEEQREEAVKNALNYIRSVESEAKGNK